MKTLTHNELIAKITAISGHTFATVETLTDTKARKTGNPYGIILKQSLATVSIGANYEGAVNRQASREDNQNAGGFVADSLPWGEWMIFGKLISHKGRVYVRTQTTSGQRKIRVPKILAFRNEKGEFIPRKEAEKFLPEKKASEKQISFGNTGEVQVRTLALDSILRIRLNGRTFKVVKG